MIILVRGGGDLASGVALRLFRAGFQVVITEIPRPLAVRRLVAFSEAVYQGETMVEEVSAVRVEDFPSILQAFAGKLLPVMVDPAADLRHTLQPDVLVDARMTKVPPELGMDAAPLVIGLGPGFIAGVDCHAVIETKRGHTLGRVIWEGSAIPDTGIPGRIGAASLDRVLRSPGSGKLQTHMEIGERVDVGQRVASVDGQELRAPFAGVIRGLLPDGFVVQKGMKIGDLDPRLDRAASRLVSDKALAIGGGVLEAVLARSDVVIRLVER
jgi:xanthine dehydrogenase accessory factor